MSTAGGIGGEKPVDPELLKIMEEFYAEGDGLSTSGQDEGSLQPLEGIPVNPETMDQLGMQSVPAGVGKMELSAKHLLIQKLLGSEEEVWRTSPKLFLARIYYRLTKLHALRAASKLLQHWPESFAIEVSDVSRVLMLVYRCVTCGMQQEQLMGCISAIVEKDTSGETSIELIKAARNVSRMFVDDHMSGREPQDAALNVALAIFSASAKQTANPAVAAELLQATTLHHLISVAHLAVGPQRRDLLRLLSQAINLLSSAAFHRCFCFVLLSFSALLFFVSSHQCPCCSDTAACSLRWLQKCQMYCQQSSQT